MKRENQIASDLVRAVAAKGGICKVAEGIDFGWPDRLILLPGGRVHWAELKTRTGATRDGQYAVNELLTALGQDVRFVRGEDELFRFVKEVL